MLRVIVAATLSLGILAPLQGAFAQSPPAGGPSERSPYGAPLRPGAEGTTTGQPGGIYAERPVPVPHSGRPTYGGSIIRPPNCGVYRYWNGHRCADARLEPPYVGPR